MRNTFQSSPGNYLIMPPLKPGEKIIQIDIRNIFIGRIHSKDKKTLTDLIVNLSLSANDPTLNIETFHKKLDTIFDETIKLADKGSTVFENENFLFLLSRAMNVLYHNHFNLTPTDAEKYVRLSSGFFESFTYNKKINENNEYLYDVIMSNYVSYALMATSHNKELNQEQKATFAKELLGKLINKNIPNPSLVAMKSEIAFYCSQIGDFDEAKNLSEEVLSLVLSNDLKTVPLPILENILKASTRIYLNNIAKLNINNMKSKEELMQNASLIRCVNTATITCHNKGKLTQISPSRLKLLLTSTEKFLPEKNVSVEDLLKYPEILDVHDNSVMNFDDIKIDYSHIKEPSITTTNYILIEAISLDLTEQDIASISAIPGYIKATNEFISLENMNYAPMLNPITNIIENKLKQLYNIYVNEYIPYLIDKEETKINKKYYSADLLREYKNALGSEKYLTIGQFCKKMTGQDSYIAGNKNLAPLHENLDLFVDFAGGFDGITLAIISHLIEYTLTTQGYRNDASHGRNIDKQSFETAVHIGLLSENSIIKNLSTILNSNKVKSLKEARQQQSREMKKRIGEERRKKAEPEMEKRKALENIVEPAVQENEERAETNVVTKSSQKTDEGFSPNGE